MKKAFKTCTGEENGVQRARQAGAPGGGRRGYLNKIVNRFQVGQVVVVDIHAEAEEEASVPPVHNLEGSKLQQQCDSAKTGELPDSRMYSRLGTGLFRLSYRAQREEQENSRSRKETSTQADWG